MPSQPFLCPKTTAHCGARRPVRRSLSLRHLVASKPEGVDGSEATADDEGGILVRKPDPQRALAGLDLGPRLLGKTSNAEDAEIAESGLSLRALRELRVSRYFGAAYTKPRKHMNRAAHGFKTSRDGIPPSLYRFESMGYLDCGLCPPRLGLSRRSQEAKADAPVRSLSWSPGILPTEQTEYTEPLARLFPCIPCVPWAQLDPRPNPYSVPRTCPRASTSREPGLNQTNPLLP